MKRVTTDETSKVSRDVFGAAAASFERAEQARRRLPAAPEAGSDEADVVAWAEDTLLTMGEFSVVLADAWERVATAMEAVAEVVPGASVGEAEDEVPPPSPGRDDEQRPEPSAEDLIGPTSFLDDMVSDRDSSSSAA